MPGADGLMLLDYIQNSESGTMVLLMTGYSGIENALHAVELGAYDFVSKPFQLPEIRVRLDNAARYQCLLRRFDALNAEAIPAVESKQPGGQMVERAYGHYSAGHH